MRLQMPSERVLVKYLQISSYKFMGTPTNCRLITYSQLGLCGDSKCGQILQNTNPLKHQFYYAQLNLTPTFLNLPFNIKETPFSALNVT